MIKKNTAKWFEIAFVANVLTDHATVTTVKVFARTVKEARRLAKKKLTK